MATNGRRRLSNRHRPTLTGPNSYMCVIMADGLMPVDVRIGAMMCTLGTSDHPGRL